MRKVLNNRKGVSYIWACVIILFTVTIVMIVMQYAYIYHVAKVQARETKLVLDSYVTKFAIENFDAIKQGESFESGINKRNLVAGAYEKLGIPQINGQLPSIVKEHYTLVAPQIAPLQNNEFGVIFRYKIIIPFEMFNRKIADIEVPNTIISAFKQK